MTIASVRNFEDWLTSFKGALVRAACDDKRSVFIVSDTDLEMNECKVLVNHVISQGDVMYLFDVNERNDLVEKMRAIDLQKEKSLQVSPISRYFLLSLVDVFVSVSSIPVYHFILSQTSLHSTFDWSKDMNMTNKRT